MNLAGFTQRDTLEDSDMLIGYRNAGADGEARWSGALIKALIAAAAGGGSVGSGLSVVTMPVDSNASGSLGQIAVGGGKLAIYVGVSGGPNWVFLDFYQIN